MAYKQFGTMTNQGMKSGDDFSDGSLLDVPEAPPSVVAVVVIVAMKGFTPLFRVKRFWKLVSYLVRLGPLTFSLLNSSQIKA